MLNDVSKAIVLDALRGSPEVRHELRDFIIETVQAVLDIRREGDQNEKLLDAREAAELLSMTPAAVRQAAYRGALPVSRVGRRLRFSRTALLALRAG